MRARVLLVVALLVAAAWFGYRHRSRGVDAPARDVRTADAGALAPLPPAEPVDAGVQLALEAPPGAAHAIAMLGAPAQAYAALTEDDEADQTYRALLAKHARGDARYDRELSRAARDAAYQAAVLGRPPPEAVLNALMHACGAAEISAMQLVVHANTDDPSVLDETLRRALAREVKGKGPLRIGVGEVTTPDDELSYHVAVLVTRRAYEVERTPRHAPLRDVWTLRGRLPDGYTDASALAMYPDGRTVALELITDDRAFELRVPTGEREGTLYVSIGGTDDRGPGKLLQLSVEVGRQPSRELDVVVPPADPELADLEAAEAHALAVLEADRARFGLPPLIPDARLADIARLHSIDMRDHDFFAHLSPRTGLAGDRLASAAYRSRMHAENLARNDSIYEAEASLLASLGHRRNILDPRLTHVGIGLARRGTGQETDWYVTQLFAVPVEQLDPERAIADVLARIGTARAHLGAAALALDADLSMIAQRHARHAADGPLEGLPQRAAEELRERSHRSATISVQATHDLTAFEPPLVALDPEMLSIGVGVHQSADDLHGRTGVVVIVSRE